MIIIRIRKFLFATILVFLSFQSALGQLLIESAEDGDSLGWVVYDSVPEGALIENVFDESRQSQVISLSGVGVSNGFRLGNAFGSEAWGHEAYGSIRWRMKSDANFVINIAVSTTAGLRYMKYDQRSDNQLLTNSIYIHHGLGMGSRNGLWQSITRDLVADLSEAEPDNQLLSVNGMYVRGSLLIDDVELFGVNLGNELMPVNPILSDYTMVFNDEFNDASINGDKWDTSFLWGPYEQINNEKQFYVDSLGMHSSVDFSPFEMTGSTLKISASAVSDDLLVPERPPVESPLWQPNIYSEYRYNEQVGVPGDANYSAGFQAENIDYLSGLITTYGSFNMTHGYVEARVKLPGGRGLWPAFWMLPVHYVQDVPEIDVMEFLGHDVDKVYHTYHYFDIANDWQLISSPSFTTELDDWTREFHTFGMAWSPQEIIWFVDGVETKRISEADYRIPNQPMYLIANLAVGGNWPGDPDESTTFPAIYEVDYIRAYKKNISTSLALDEEYQVVFEDDFTGDSLDPDKWNTHFLWGPYLPINNEEQYYVDTLGSDPEEASPFSVSEGILSITARAVEDPLSFSIPQSLPDPDDSIWSQFDSFQQNQNYSQSDYNYTSGIITSYDSFKFSHGYAEIRAKVPSGDGLWPAFWLLNAYYVGQQPEIDIMEVRGENPSQIVHSYHRLDTGEQVSSSYTTHGGNMPLGYADDFHTYGVRWRPGLLEWYIDRELVQSYEGDDVAYQLMYVIANLAVGGDFNFNEVDASVFPVSFDIDYIRVYQEKGLP